MPQFNIIAKQLNNVFDNTDDYLSAELKAIIDHRFSNSILEFQVKYINGDVEWHHSDLVKDEYPYVTTNYIIDNDLGPIGNMTHNPSPTYRKRRSHRYAQNNGAPAGTLHKTDVPKKRRSFKFGLEVLKFWKDTLRIDDESGNMHWQNAVTKEITALIRHKYFEFKSPNSKLHI